MVDEKTPQFDDKRLGYIYGELVKILYDLKFEAWDALLKTKEYYVCTF